MPPKHSIPILTLPPELRLRIYDHLISPSTKAEPRLDIFSGRDKIQYIDRSSSVPLQDEEEFQPLITLSQTCALLLAEVLPTLYSRLHLTVQWASSDHSQSSGTMGDCVLLGNHPLFGYVQHLKVRMYIFCRRDIQAGFDWLENFSKGLDSGGAELRTLEVEVQVLYGSRRAGSEVGGARRVHVEDVRREVLASAAAAAGAHSPARFRGMLEMATIRELDADDDGACCMM